MKLPNNRILAGLLAFFLVAVAVANAAEKPPGVALKPDITITDMKIERISSTPTEDNVRISVTVMNPVRGTSTGPFKIKVEWTENPSAGFTLLGTSGVSNLVNDPSSIAVRGETRTFDHVVPKGKSYKYRATADYMSQVAESNEANNVNSGGYVAA
jgi:hypothetical protein